MKAQMEREVKLCLTAFQHRQLAQLLGLTFGPAQVLQQNNRFFDSTKSHLRQAQCSLRLRLQNQSCLLTIKQKQAQLGSLHQHMEYEMPIHCALWPSLINNSVDIQHVIQLHPCIYQAAENQSLQCIGGFTNQRIEWHIPGAQICLDKTTFSAQHIDYELEIEAEDAEGESHKILQLLHNWNIQVTPQLSTKMSRYLSYK
ncbi:MAG: CYTH domain-containing protein [Planctomycetes bacterium]|nr:CYTH domain-containing protein [Planctomycetota bacterium]